jgi:hypothetical protein
MNTKAVAPIGARPDAPINVQAITLSELERMAASIAKSGMFACKTPEAALTLCLVAQAEGIHPAQALMDYDLIQGKPALKSAAMLARFQRGGGKVTWLQASDAVVEGKFEHPSCGAPVVVKWDDARLKTAGLGDAAMHKKFGQQMKRARCITEGIRATAPQCIPLGMYTVEETQDIAAEEPGRVVRTDSQVSEQFENVATALTTEEVEGHINAMNVLDMEALRAAFEAACIHANNARDKVAKDRFKQVYDIAKAALTPKNESGGLI